MKPLERIFFMSCVHEQLRVEELSEREFTIRIIANIYTRFGFSYKQLMYYAEKWSYRGFYNYGVTLDLGWFEFDKLRGEYKEIYEEVKKMPVSQWKDGELSDYIMKNQRREINHGTNNV